MATQSEITRAVINYIRTGVEPPGLLSWIQRYAPHLYYGTKYFVTRASEGYAYTDEAIGGWAQSVTNATSGGWDSYSTPTPYRDTAPVAAPTAGTVVAGYAPPPAGYNAVETPGGVSYVPQPETTAAAGVPAGAPAGAPATSAGPTTPAGPTPEQEAAIDAKKLQQGDARAQLDKILGDLGLGVLSEEAWLRIQRDESEAQILQWVYGTKEYQAHYSGLVTLKERAKAGEAVSVMNEKEYNDYLQSASSIMRFYNIPADFYDTRDDIGALIGKGVSLREIEERVTNGYDQVAKSPAPVKDAFAEMFGIHGDAMLAAFFLDPTKGEALIERNIRTAQALGYSRMAGGQMTGTGATRVGSMGLSADQVRQGVQSIAGMNDALTETISENQDLTADQAGVDAVFNGNIEPIRRRTDQRRADFAGGGGAAQTRTGLGFGSSE